MSTAVIGSPFPSSTISSRPRAISATPVGRLRITRRGRAVITAMIAVPLVAGAVIAVLSGGMAAASGENSHAAFEYVRVESGQSLWQMAEAIAPQADPREFIADVSDLNRLETAVVQPGQRLAIPSEYSH